jgi:type I site-specific restriction endonuclease
LQQVGKQDDNTSDHDRSRHLPRIRHAPIGRGWLGHCSARHRRAAHLHQWPHHRGTGGKVRRGKQKRADYLLYYRRDYPLAVVEAKELGSLLKPVCSRPRVR